MQEEPTDDSPAGSPKVGALSMVKGFATKLRRRRHSIVAERLMDNPIAKAVARKLALHIGNRDGITEINRMFKELDKDNSGELDCNEFTEGLQGYGFQLTEADVAALFMVIDLDGGGTVSNQEFEHFVKAELEVIALEEEHGGSGTGSASVIKALHGGTRFQRTGSVMGDLSRQGDVEMLSEFAVGAREDLKINDTIRVVIEGWWKKLRLLTEEDRARFKEEKESKKRGSNW
jgi:hypothetical protein